MHADCNYIIYTTNYKCYVMQYSHDHSLYDKFFIMTDYFEFWTNRLKLFCGYGI